MWRVTWRKKINKISTLSCMKYVSNFETAYMAVAIENKQQDTKNKNTQNKTTTTNKQTPTQHPRNYFVIQHSITDLFLWTYRVQARSWGGRWSRTFKLAQKRSWTGRWSWAATVRLLSLRVVPQQQCNGHCPCDSAQHGSWNSNCAVH